MDKKQTLTASYGSISCQMTKHHTVYLTRIPAHIIHVDALSRIETQVDTRTAKSRRQPRTDNCEPFVCRHAVRRGDLRSYFSSTQ